MNDDLEKRLLRVGERIPVPCPDGIKGCLVAHYSIETNPVCREAAATIAALKAQIERAGAVIAEIAEFCTNTGKGNPMTDERIIDRVEEVAVEYLRALSAEAIAKGEG
jgi:hypothetical protein